LVSSSSDGTQRDLAFRSPDTEANRQEAKNAEKVWGCLLTTRFKLRSNLCRARGQAQHWAI
jgi:hypothetical protein